jgi:hypothetical protein
MRKHIVLPKNESLTISDQILYLFKKEGGVYKIARKNNIEGTNLYARIKRSDNAINRVCKLLKLIDHDLSYGIIKLKETEKKNQK